MQRASTVEECLQKAPFSSMKMPHHTAKTTKEKITSFNYETRGHPLYKPDLHVVPNDHQLFGHRKDALHRHHLSIIEEVEEHV